MGDAYYFDDGVLSVETEDTQEDVAIAGLQGIEIEPGYDIIRHYTADSTHIESQKQQEHEVPVTIDYSKFDVDAARQWLGGSGASSGASTDTSDPQKFTVKAVSTSAGGGVERTCEVEGVTFDSFPLVSGSRGEFEEYNLSGTGERISQFEDTST